LIVGISHLVRVKAPQILRLVVLAASVLCACKDSILAEEKRDPATLPICSSWVEASKTFRTVGIFSISQEEDFCPAGMAYFSVNYPGNMSRPGNKVRIEGTCCPMPVGSLLDEHVFAGELCPSGYVATGARQQIDSLPDPSPDDSNFAERTWTNRRIQELRCTKIDKEKIVLGPVRPGANIGWEQSFRTFFDGYLNRPSIPIALRLGFGRTGAYSWQKQICVGQPWGSVLVGKQGKHCAKMLFSEFQPAPKAKEPQQLFGSSAYEECLYLINPYSSSARCAARKSAAMQSWEAKLGE
jgi:hypothetical protein